MITYIYALIDPRDAVVRYVGKTVNPTKRFQHHKQESHSQEIQVLVQELASLGLELTMRILEEVAEGDDWKGAESLWVRHGFEHGWPICNKRAGGDGVPLEFITSPNPELKIYRIIQVKEPTAILCADVTNMRERKELLDIALTLLSLCDHLEGKKQADFLKKKGRNLPKWQSAPRRKDGSLWLGESKEGFFEADLFMKKKNRGFTG